jgi:aminopeptidase YwaD
MALAASSLPPGPSQFVRSPALWLTLAAVSASGCHVAGPTDSELARSVAEAQRLQATADAFDPDGGVVRPSWYRGPGVQQGNSGPARFVSVVRDGFDRPRAEERLAWLDAQYRAPASPEYDLALDRLTEELREVGYGDEARGFELLVLSTAEPVDAWSPVRAALELHAGDAAPLRLHGFERSADRDRVMLPVGAPSAQITAPVALSLRDLQPGQILVTEVPLPQVLDRAHAQGAVAVVSASLGTYNVDPSGRERHLDAIQYRELRQPAPVPVAQISPRSFERIAAAVQRGPAQLSLQAEVRVESRPLRTLVAVVRGAVHPDRVVGISAHVQEPGANDNCSGVTTVIECARLLALAIEDGRLKRPAASIAFVLGDEFRQTEAFLDANQRRVVAGISADMTGASRTQSGAIALLERSPDPGALHVYPPDEHSAWGAGEVSAEDIVPTGLALIARCAMIDVGLAEGAWDSADHPWEGGSDHDTYLARGIPAVLFWHFTDFAYHTSLDRLENVEVDEVRRTGTAILTTALAVADAKPADLDRYLVSLDHERRVRVEAAEAAADPETAAAWVDWAREARHWLRALCLDRELEEIRPPREVATDGAEQ